jgi:hypothetical protein
LATIQGFLRDTVGELTNNIFENAASSIREEPSGAFTKKSAPARRIPGIDLLSLFSY